MIIDYYKYWYIYVTVEEMSEKLVGFIKQRKTPVFIYAGFAHVSLNLWFHSLNLWFNNLILCFQFTSQFFKKKGLRIGVPI